MIKFKILEYLGWYKPVHYNHKRFERLARRCESPIESAFWSAGYFELSKLGQLTPQVKVGPYRLDFMFQANGLKLAIELDGQDYHSSREQRMKDYQRQRHLEAQGWRIIRFTGAEIYGDVQRCVGDVVRLVRTVAI